jgi:hypothetical protein
VDDYIEHGRKLPNREIVLQTLDADYFYFKADILAGLITYSTDKRIAANLETITAERAKQIIEMNRHGEKPAGLQDEHQQKQQQQEGTVDLLAGDSITRFDKSKKKKKKKPQQQAAHGGETPAAQQQKAPAQQQKAATQHKDKRQHQQKPQEGKPQEAQTKNEPKHEPKE